MQSSMVITAQMSRPRRCSLTSTCRSPRRKGTKDMAKKSMIEREKKRERLVARYAAKRAELKEIANDESKPMEERFKARLKLAKLPRNSSPTRLHNRCQITGRPHAYYRKLKISRIALRDLGSNGKLPGVVKSSW